MFKDENLFLNILLLMLENIIFYYPSRRVGGAQLLFYRCADWLTKIQGIKVWYIDYQDGYIKRNSKNNNISFVDGITIPARSVVILPLSMMLMYDKLFEVESPDQTRFLFWAIHPKNLTGFFTIKGKTLLPHIVRNMAGKHLEYLTRNGIIRYMDYPNYHQVCSCFNIKEDSNIDYLPIPFGDSRKILPYPISRGDVSKKKDVSFLWLSRIMADKVPYILNLFNELDGLHQKLNKKIVLHIVGDGDCEEIVRENSRRYDFNTIMYGRQTGDELDKLIDKIDIGVAVGTSALEIAKRCKPVIMGGPCMYGEHGKIREKGEQKEYILLSKTYGFSVGAPEMYTECQTSFSNLVLDIMTSYDTIAAECWRYVRDNHSIDKVGESLLSAVTRCYSFKTGEMYRNLKMLKHELLPMKNIVQKTRNMFLEF